MKDTKKRREEIIEVLKKNEEPLNGESLSKMFNVSRQVIVQDIAILKAEKFNIISTNRGYTLYRKEKPEKIIKVSHKDDLIEKELNAAVDLGAEIKDVFVWHKVYGKISCPLNIKSRKDVKIFIDNLNSGVSRPLKRITDDYHYHTLIAEDKETLEEVEKAWEDLGIIANKKDKNSD